MSSSDPASVLASLARSCAAKRGGQPRGDDVSIPTVADLCGLVESANSSERFALEESQTRCVEVLPQLGLNQNWALAEWRIAHVTDIALCGRKEVRGKEPMLYAYPDVGLPLILSVGNLHALWRAAKPARQAEGRDPPRHPVAPLVDAWQQRPKLLVPETRRDRRVLPRIESWESRPERRAGELFAGFDDGRDPHAGLPAFPSRVPQRHRVPLLDMVDAAGLPVVARGGAAPLESRLFVRVLTCVRPQDRREPYGQIAITFSELRDGMFPRGWQRWRDWPRLQTALLRARDYAIHDGRGRWWPVALRYMPDKPGPRDVIVLDVAFPPGSDSGPPVPLPALDRLSVRSASQWRAYIASQSLAWRPGVTRVPAPRAGGRFTWTQSLTAYPVLTAADRRRLAFGAQDAKHRSRDEINNAFLGLPGLVIVTERAVDPQTGEAGWIVLPEEAAAAVGNVGSKRRMPR